MSLQITFYIKPTVWSLAPPHPNASAPDDKLLRNVQFDPDVFRTHDQRRSASNGILWLPLGSIVAAFASGHNTHPPAENLTPFVYIRKDWHQNPNKHCTMRLGWNDQQGKLFKMFGQAHVHRNGLESILEWSTGGTLVRPYGQAGYDWHPPAAFASSVPAQQAASAPVAQDWTDSDDEAEEEGWGRRVITLVFLNELSNDRVESS